MRLADQLYVARQLVFGLRSQWWSAARIQSYREAQLVRIMRHAATCVPFYRRLDLRADSISRATDLNRFPLIRKGDIQRDPMAFLADGFTTANTHASRTSGSSGEPTITYFDRESWLLSRFALKMRRVAATDGLPFMRRVMVVSEQRPEDLHETARAAPNGFRVAFEQRYLSIHTAPETHIAELQRFRPHIIYAFPSYLVDLIEVAGRLGKVLPGIDTLCTSSEVLTAAVRMRIEEAFGGRLYDVYGNTEFKEVAWQCGHGSYHLNFESVHVEPQRPADGGPVVLSTLCNRAMPLLRFDTGDRAGFGSEQCRCGRASPVLTWFAGREGDMILLPSGRRLSPYVLTTEIETIDQVRKYRIVQTAADAFRVDVVMAGSGRHDDWQARLCADLERTVAEPVNFTVQVVNEIDRAAGGKHAVFVRACPTPG